MQILSEDITDFRDRLLSWLKFWFFHIGTGIWKRLRPVALHGIVWIVSLYRLTLRRVVFIGVTGSCGKTTTTEMIEAVLSSQYHGHKSRGGHNNLGEMIRSVLLTRRGYQFCVQEVNIAGMSNAVPVEKRLKMFRPQLGGDHHWGRSYQRAR